MGYSSTNPGARSIYFELPGLPRCRSRIGREGQLHILHLDFIKFDGHNIPVCIRVKDIFGRINDYGIIFVVGTPGY